MSKLTLTHCITVLIAAIITKWSVFISTREFCLAVPSEAHVMAGDGFLSENSSFIYHPGLSCSVPLLHSWRGLFVSDRDGKAYLCSIKGKTRARIIVTLLNIANSSLPLLSRA